jgi:CDP-6-deoxy-D-xylo-4-hexulose-3-dehydrase
MKFKPGVDRIQYGGALIGQEEKDAINAIIDSQGGRRWTIGPESVAFEKELASVVGVKRAVVVNSGSSALLIAMTALHLPRGSKVIIPAVNFPTAFNAIIQCGLIPVVVDVDIRTLNLDLEEVEKAVIFHDIKAVIAVDVAGNPVDLIKLREIVGKKVKIVLDDCDGFGTTIKDNNSEDWKAQFFIEQFADISCVSFHAAHIITMGEGGAVLTDDEKLADRCVKLREWGRASGTDKIYKYEGFPDDYKERYVYEEIGYNMKPLELQCAMGRVQLKKLQSFKDARRINHARLVKEFEKNDKFTMIESLQGSDPCWFSFPVLCNTPRKHVMEEFEKNNIECRTIFSGNIIRHPAYKDTKYIKIGDLTAADDVMKRGMFLSCHPSITEEMTSFIGDVAWKI